MLMLLRVLFHNSFFSPAAHILWAVNVPPWLLLHTDATQTAAQLSLGISGPTCPEVDRSQRYGKDLGTDMHFL